MRFGDFVRLEKEKGVYNFDGSVSYIDENYAEVSNKDDWFGIFFESEDGGISNVKDKDGNEIKIEILWASEMSFIEENEIQVDKLYHVNVASSDLPNDSLIQIYDINYETGLVRFKSMEVEEDEDRFINVFNGLEKRGGKGIIGIRKFIWKSEFEEDEDEDDEEFEIIEKTDHSNRYEVATSDRIADFYIELSENDTLEYLTLLLKRHFQVEKPRFIRDVYHVIKNSNEYKHWKVWVRKLQESEDVIPKISSKSRKLKGDMKKLIQNYETSKRYSYHDFILELLQRLAYTGGETEMYKHRSGLYRDEDIKLNSDYKYLDDGKLRVLKLSGDRVNVESYNILGTEVSELPPTEKNIKEMVQSRGASKTLEALQITPFDVSGSVPFPRQEPPTLKNIRYKELKKAASTREEMKREEMKREEMNPIKENSPIRDFDMVSDDKLRELLKDIIWDFDQIWPRSLISKIVPDLDKDLLHNVQLDDTLKAHLKKVDEQNRQKRLEYLNKVNEQTEREQQKNQNVKLFKQNKVINEETMREVYEVDWSNEWDSRKKLDILEGGRYYRFARKNEDPYYIYRIQDNTRAFPVHIFLELEIDLETKQTERLRECIETQWTNKEGHTYNSIITGETLLVDNEMETPMNHAHTLQFDNEREADVELNFLSEMESTLVKDVEHFLELFKVKLEYKIGAVQIAKKVFELPEWTQYIELSEAITTKYSNIDEYIDSLFANTDKYKVENKGKMVNAKVAWTKLRGKKESETKEKFRVTLLSDVTKNYFNTTLCPIIGDITFSYICFGGQLSFTSCKNRMGDFFKNETLSFTQEVGNTLKSCFQAEQKKIRDKLEQSARDYWDYHVLERKDDIEFTKIPEIQNVDLKKMKISQVQFSFKIEPSKKKSYEYTSLETSIDILEKTSLPFKVEGIEDKEFLTQISNQESEDDYKKMAFTLCQIIGQKKVKEPIKLPVAWKKLSEKNIHKTIDNLREKRFGLEFKEIDIESKLLVELKNIFRILKIMERNGTKENWKDVWIGLVIFILREVQQNQVRDIKQYIKHFTEKFIEVVGTSIQNTTMNEKIAISKENEAQEFIKNMSSEGGRTEAVKKLGKFNRGSERGVDTIEDTFEAPPKAAAVEVEQLDGAENDFNDQEE